MIEIRRHGEHQKSYRLRQRLANKRSGQYDWSYHSTLGELTDPTACDLVEIAKAVFLADRAFRRSTRLGSQARQISVRIPVHSVEIWSKAAPILEQIARFVSADDWCITFTKAKPKSRSESTAKVVDKRSVVALFSGGLDSLCGAAYLYLNDAKPVFVTHSPPGQKRVSNLVREMAHKLGKSELADATQFVSFRLAPIERNSAGFRSMFQEPSRRTRPLFFLSLAGAVAIDRKIPTIQMSENGALAINLPIRSDAYGARCARQAHNKALRLFQLLLTIVCPSVKNWRVINPFEDMTKGEASMLLGMAKSFARRSVSCEYVGKQAATIRAWKKRHRYGKKLGTGPECGICIPCIVRRAALKKAGIKDDSSWYFFDARRTASESQSKIESSPVPLYKFVSSNVYSLQRFSTILRHMSFRDFVAQYFPELRLASGDSDQFADECKRIYKLERRFATEILNFLGNTRDK